MINWAKEARDLKPDPVSGAEITRLSGSSIRTENIYCTAPCATPDGNRFASMRYIDSLIGPVALMCHDLKTKFTCLLEKSLENTPISAAWGAGVYFLKGTELFRADMYTCQTKPVMDLKGMPKCWQLMSISRDEKYLLYTGIVKEEPESYNLIMVNLQDKSWRGILKTPETNRLGGAFDPDAGDKIVINKTEWIGERRYGVGVICDLQGNMGKPLFKEVHHATWVGGNRMVSAAGINYEGYMSGVREKMAGDITVHDLKTGIDKVIPMGPYLPYHVSGSACGRYFVCEGIENDLVEGESPIVVVDVVSGKYRALVQDCRCSGGGDSGRQVKPYFTADNGHVIYTADPDGVVNVFAAKVPEGFLEGLG
jgi:hypothetical protein